MLVDTVGDEDPRRALAGAAELRRAAEQLQGVAVRRARMSGMTWAEIAALLQVSKQAAHRKYRGYTFGVGGGD